MTELWIQDRDARATFGFTVSRVESLHGAPSVSVQPQVIPGRPGAILLAEPQTDTRTLTVQGVLRGESLVAVRRRRDQLLAVLRHEGVTLRTADDATRQLAVTVTGVTSTTPSPQMIARSLVIEITCVALDPWWRDVTPTVVSGIGTSPVPCPLGSAPVRPVLMITGAGSVVHVTQRDALGDLVTQLQLAGLTPGVPVTIDCEAQTIRQGNLSQLRTLLAGDFPVLDPTRHADIVAEAWPTLAVSQGALQATYQRRWA